MVFWSNRSVATKGDQKRPKATKRDQKRPNATNIELLRRPLATMFFLVKSFGGDQRRPKRTKGDQKGPKATKGDQRRPKGTYISLLRRPKTTKGDLHSTVESTIGDQWRPTLVNGCRCGDHKRPRAGDGTLWQGSDDVGGVPSIASAIDRRRGTRLCQVCVCVCVCVSSVCVCVVHTHSTHTRRTKLGNDR